MPSSPSVDFARPWLAFPFLLLHISLELHHADRDGCISEETFLGHTQYRCEKRVEQQWREHTPLPKILLHIERIPTSTPITRPHACSHAVVELMNDGKHSRRYAKASKGSPQKDSADGPMCFGEVLIKLRYGKGPSIRWSGKGGIPIKAVKIAWRDWGIDCTHNLE